MQYMVELRYPLEHRDEALKYFLQHGTIGYEGKVTLASAWVATQDRIAYAIVESGDLAELEKACAPLRAFGDVAFRSVTSVDQL